MADEQQASQAPPTAFQEGQTSTESNRQQNVTRELARQFRWVEFAQIGSSLILAIVGIVALSIYEGQLNVMRRQLGEIAKQYPEIQKSANAAKSAADTAADTLKSSKESFQIEQRPYTVVDIPQFVIPPMTSGTTSANLTFRNIGRTPAIVSNAQMVLLLLHESKDGVPGGKEGLSTFLENNFHDLAHKLDMNAKDKYASRVRIDLAPSISDFATRELKQPLMPSEVAELEKGDLMLFYLGIIRYTDAFKGSYETQFCFYYFGNNPKTWHICDTHNTIQ
jgi:hypothetical protein